MSTKVFIDGSAGTTGLRIRERLAERADIQLIILPDELRKDTAARAAAIAEADVAFLCLPDAAAIEIVAVVDAAGCDTCIIDTSTAHRVNEAWTYGFAELKGQREAVAAAKRIANPGCHATGFISTMAPLVQLGFVPADARLSAYSLTGYSGGGKKMIEQYESDDRDVLLDAPRVYGLTQSHKHLPEMVKVCGLDHAPAFSPIVAPYYSGMLTCVSLFDTDPDAIRAALADYYAGAQLVCVNPEADEAGFMSGNAFSGRDSLEIAVFGNPERALVCARFDNLGKGASGAAIQNMNIVLGVDETLGLVK